MKNRLAILVVLFVALLSQSVAAENTIDTVYTGIYVTSIHDIDFKQQEYAMDLWLWLQYKNKDFDFEKNLEIPQAKSFTKSYSTTDTSGGQVFLLMKIQCVMKDSWKINNFPFDQQNLRFFIENAEFDSRQLVFAADTAGQHFDPKFTLKDWDIDSFKINIGTKAYETDFGDATLSTPHSEYSSFKVKIELKRDAMGLFWKIFLGMYVAFLISYICFYIHADHIDSRFGLSVGALFAVIGNKYIIDSSLPDTTTFTLVDTLHGLTLFFIFATVTCSVFSLQMAKKNKIKEANRFDKVMAIVFLVTYIALNAYFIYNAHLSA
ncbi:ligand-gated ion channel [Ferruginibacter albus]|uniref:hypothetical protein n=1 Tax=Ferruginibacter albus TaxID=2875540 RepID=UPI001CC5D20F|nr:hypothetical protein [Ferruginibacter albus]UAY51145.1 hypothetical protein K9M53_11150 [Ferruginibacter albus]